MLLALDLDDAHPAGPEAGQLGLVAQGRDLDPVVAADLEDRLALEALDDPAVDLDPDARRRLRPLRRLRRRGAARRAIVGGVGRASAAAVGAGDQVGHRVASVGPAPAATAIGWQTPAGQELRRMCSSSSDRKYRIPLANGRVVRRSWSHRADADDVGRQVGQELRRRSAAGGRSTTRSPISTSRRVPIRHGIVLPHASSAQKRVSRRARSTMQARSSATTTEPEPTWAPAARSGSKSYGVSSSSGGSRPPDGPPTRTALSVRPRRQLAAERDDRRAAASRAGPRRCRRPPAPRTWTRIVPGLPCEPIAANASAPLADDPGDGGQGLDVVDDGRRAEQAALGGVRRPLLGLAALALERLEQDGLLAEHVGALDRPDRDRQVAAGAERRRRR